MEVFKVNGINIEKDVFMTKIIDALDIAKFASIDQLVIMLKAKHIDVKTVLQDIIIWYVKEHPNVPYQNLCIDLNIRSEYVDELIADGRLEENSAYLEFKNQLNGIEESASALTGQFIRDLQRREAIRGLQGSISKPASNDDLSLRKVNKFFTRPGEHNKRW